ncbi:TNT antitoxin family protein [Mycobacterium montefiorense]|uniref:TNT antitoxin family protein n=1 Tax=Mycobacterium montefiorense TaxID=154654 RepID=UPI0021DD98A2|nr:TNT antitoxin family protein [Mycobacterium montefiorense]MCV7425475.1 TNT antitoxin family protein [Mycobacterium montefiorense]GLE52413.1 hypothetical protein ATCCBAA256_19810 [Mycobacterium montefiorense]
MTTSVELSNELQDWLRLAGVSTTQGSQTDDGRTIVWTKLGESRYFIDVIDNWYVMTCSDRMGPEAYEFSADSMAVIEKYLFGTYGGIIRGDEGLPRVRMPFQRHELRPEYSIGKQIFAQRERHTLVDRTGKVVAIAGIEDLVELSHYLDVSVDVIKRSYLAPDGKPIFTVWRDA